MKPTEQEKLQFGIEIVAAMFAERLHNGDLDAGMIDALSETEIDRLGFSEEDLKAMPEDRQEMIRKMVAFHKTRLHQQAMFMANTVLSSGFISQMQPEWVSINSVDDLPEIGLPVLVQTEYISSGVPCTDCFTGYLDHDGELMGYPSDDPYGWSFKECVKQWAPIPQPPTK